MGRTEAASRAIAVEDPISGTLAVTAASPDVRVIEFDEDHCVGSWGCIYVMIWRRATPAATARRVHSGIVDFARANRRIGIVTLIEEQASLPPPESRKVLAALMNDVEPFAVRSAVICEGSGFRAAAFRAASTGIALLANYSFPHKVFAKVELGAAWISKGLNDELGPGPRGPQIAKAVDDIRDRRRG